MPLMRSRRRRETLPTRSHRRRRMLWPVHNRERRRNRMSHDHCHNRPDSPEYHHRDDTCQHLSEQPRRQPRHHHGTSNQLIEPPPILRRRKEAKQETGSAAGGGYRRSANLQPKKTQVGDQVAPEGDHSWSRPIRSRRRLRQEAKKIAANSHSRNTQNI